MSNNKPLIDADGEVRELTACDFNKIKPLSVADPALFKMLKAAKASRGVQVEPTKERITIRLSQDVTEYFRASGKGWQSRMNGALKEWIAEH